MLQGRVWGGPRCGHADAPIPLPDPIGGKHRGSLAVPCAEEGQRGALPPLPAPAWHEAPRPPPSPGPTCQVAAKSRGVPLPSSTRRLGQRQCPPVRCSAVGQAVGLGTAGGAAVAKSISQALCPMPRLQGQGRMPRSPEEMVRGLWGGGGWSWSMRRLRGHPGAAVAARSPGSDPGGGGAAGVPCGMGTQDELPLSQPHCCPPLPRAGPCAGALPQGRAALPRQRGCAAAGSEHWHRPGEGHNTPPPPPAHGSGGERG